jgi:Uma2 family endonuclease
MGALENYVNNILARLLNFHVETNRLGMVHVESLFEIDAKRNLKRRPDLAFVSAARWPISKTPPRREAWDLIPDLVVEVISESNTAEEIVRKVEDYFKAGVREVWVLYPDVRMIYVYTGPKSVRIISDDDELDGGDVVPGFRAAVKDVFGRKAAVEEERPAEKPPGS